MLTIGEFSRISFVTKKTLRHYDQIGLLQPEHTADNGYRYYTVDQLRTMLFISRLKNYGFSLPEIAVTLADPDELRLADKILEKHRQMKNQVQAARRTLKQMEQDMDKLKRRMDIMEQNIAINTVELEPMDIYSIRKRLHMRYFSESMGQLFQDVQRKKLRPAGPPMAFYHDDDFESEFDHENADVEFAIPVAEGEGTLRTSGGLHCHATILGPYGDEAFTPVYVALMKWVEENGYHIAGSPFDIYARGGQDCKPEDYVTEVYVPIAK